MSVFVPYHLTIRPSPSRSGTPGATGRRRPLHLRAVIRKRLNYWTLILGPKFSRRERAAMNLSRFYAVSQVEYCRNFVFKTPLSHPPHLRARLRNRTVAHDR